ncbi:hypothetical protein GW7_19300 [Heterocephalus glaber]|uniref:Uncharacterized protein n=1 Tax=Heterocephalus glaber TaxID=10181 RepID=G5AXX2_HETGA|nr:hypothetical protein GW7_19300 [Heterocephalus glaber]
MVLPCFTRRNNWQGWSVDEKRSEEGKRKIRGASKNQDYEKLVPFDLSLFSIVKQGFWSTLSLWSRSPLNIYVTALQGLRILRASPSGGAVHSALPPPSSRANRAQATSQRQEVNRAPGGASVKGALLSLVTRSLARCGRSPPEGALCLGCLEPENGPAPRGNIAEDPGFPRRLKAEDLCWLAAETGRHKEPEATQKDGGTDRQMVCANRRGSAAEAEHREPPRKRN